MTRGSMMKAITRNWPPQGQEKWVELENPSDQICPPTMQSLFSGVAEGWLLFLSLVSRRNGLIGGLKILRRPRTTLA